MSLLHLKLMHTQLLISSIEASLRFIQSISAWRMVRLQCFFPLASRAKEEYCQIQSQNYTCLRSINLVELPLICGLRQKNWIQTQITTSIFCLKELVNRRKS
uniref:Uncharacterized protein n=1 Tax=Arundo donax TaxID=35708 RepID=A0A0A9E534_ARUDO